MSRRMAQAIKPVGEMTQPEDLARIVARVVAPANTASISEPVVNCNYEAMS